jgi:hypothetical protein
VENKDLAEERHSWHAVKDSLDQEGWLFAPCAPFEFHQVKSLDKDKRKYIDILKYLGEVVERPC